MKFITGVIQLTRKFSSVQSKDKTTTNKQTPKNLFLFSPPNISHRQAAQVHTPGSMDLATGSSWVEPSTSSPQLKQIITAGGLEQMQGRVQELREAVQHLWRFSFWKLLRSIFTCFYSLHQKIQAFTNIFTTSDD